MTTPFRFIPVWSPRSVRRGMDGAASAKPADMFLAFRRVPGMPHKKFGMPRPGFPFSVLAGLCSVSSLPAR